MRTKMPWSLDELSDSASAAFARRRAAGGGPTERDRPGDPAADMAAIAAELARLQDPMVGAQPMARRDLSRSDARGLIRDAVAEIARRQADLDRQGEPAPAAATGRVAPSARTTMPDRDAPPHAGPVAPTRSRGASAAPVGLRTSGTDLSAEVAATFARFSKDLHAAIRETDVRPDVAELGRQVNQIGQAVDGLAKAEPRSRIEDPTQAVPKSGSRPGSLDPVERQVAALEARLGRLATAPDVTAAVPPGFSDTLADVRRLLEGLNPRATMTSLETRLDDITARISRGFDDERPVGLIENLGRRVDEVHASLRSQLAEAAIDTRPLEGLVRGLSERLGQARAATVDFEHLETAMREVAAKVDAVGTDPRAVQGIEMQLARLAERLDRSETSLKALDGVEQALGELFSQFEVTRQVAIDAAETAARTAARDALRAALQNPSFAAQRVTDPAPALAEQVARGLDELRALQQSSEQRAQTTLSDMRALLDRLVHAQVETGSVARSPAAADETRRRRAPVPEAAAPIATPASIDPVDLLIEPGHGRNFQTRNEPRFGPEPDIAAVPGAAEPDGPAAFIAAARRAAQAAQASAASAAALKDADRAPPRRAGSARRRRPESEAASVSTSVGVLSRTRAFLADRRRPILLGLAAIVLLVGALEVVKLGVAPGQGTRRDTSEAASPVRTAGLDPSAATASAPASGPAVPATEAVLPPVKAQTPAPLPTFVTGATKVASPSEGIGEGLRSLAASGDAGAQYEVGLRYAEGRGVARDPRQALAWFEKAAAQGSAPAQYRVGSSYEKGLGVDRDAALAMSWYAKAADAGNIRAMHNLAVMSAEGAGAKPDYAKAAQWFGKASNYGVRDSQFNLAILYARGLGIEQSLAQSYKWFAVAAAQGDEDSAKKRDEVASKLDAAALAGAKAAVEAFRAATPSAAANEVAPPAGGWDAPTARPVGSPSSRVSQL